MTRSKHVLATVEEALDRPEDERDGWLRDRLGADPVALAEARALLASCARDDSFLDAPLVPRSTELPTGSAVGGFRLLRHLASGGMGDVYEAEQDDPRRRVALKLMRFGLRSPDALRRFRYEVEVLARLRHPSIAPIFEAGMHRVGDLDVPYFAMEFVDGAQPLSAYVRDRRLGIGQRLQMFLQICEGVQYGHQLGVVHRDLKPANLLVGVDGRPRIIDYGIARSLDVDDGGDTLTLTGQLMGTVGYMSPEQVEDPQQVDTRTDVYALGVVLYELLAGRLPFDLDGVPLSKALRIVAEGAPATLREVAPGLPRELGWIVARAMEKDPSRRYSGVAALEADLRRFLAGEPVDAGPPSRVYRLRKLVQRNRALFGLGALLVIALVAAVVGTSRGLAEAREQTRVAETARKQAEEARRTEAEQRAIAEREAWRQRVAFDTLTEMLGAVSPIEEGRSVTVLQVLERTRGRIPKQFADEPVMLALIQVTLAEVYEALGEYDVAEELARSARQLMADDTGPGMVRPRLRVHEVLAGVALGRGQFDAAEQQAEAMLAASGDAYPDGRRVGKSLLVDIARSRGHWEDAILLSQELLGDPGLSARAAALQRIDLAISLGEVGRRAEAAAVAAEAVRIATEEFGEAHPITMSAVYEEAINAIKLGVEPTEQVRRLERVLEVMERVVGPDSESAIAVHRQLGPAYAWAGQIGEGERHLREACRIAESRLGPAHPLTTATATDLAINLGVQGRFDEAIGLLLETVEERERLDLALHSDQVRLIEGLAITFNRAGKGREAVVWFRKQAALADQLRDRPDPLRGRARTWLANGLAAIGQFEEAERIAREALTELEPFDSEEALLYRARAHHVLNQVCESAGRADEAREHAEAEQVARSAREALRAAGRAAVGGDAVGGGGR